MALTCTSCGHCITKHAGPTECPDVCPWCYPTLLQDCCHAPREPDAALDALVQAVDATVITDRAERTTRWTRRALWLFATLHALTSAYEGRDAGVSYLLGFLCAWFTYRLKDFALERIAAREAKNKSKVIT